MLVSFADPALTEERFTQLRENLQALAGQVRERAPRGRLVFVEYLSVLPPDPGTDTGHVEFIDEIAGWEHGSAAIALTCWISSCRDCM